LFVCLSACLDVLNEGRAWGVSAFPSLYPEKEKQPKEEGKETRRQLEQTDCRRCSSTGTRREGMHRDLEGMYPSAVVMNRFPFFVGRAIGSQGRTEREEGSN